MSQPTTAAIEALSDLLRPTLLDDVGELVRHHEATLGGVGSVLARGEM